MQSYFPGNCHSFDIAQKDQSRNFVLSEKNLNLADRVPTTSVRPWRTCRWSLRTSRSPTLPANVGINSFWTRSIFSTAGTSRLETASTGTAFERVPRTNPGALAKLSLREASSSTLVLTTTRVIPLMLASDRRRRKSSKWFKPTLR